jgi:hypothetical protein
MARTGQRVDEQLMSLPYPSSFLRGKLLSHDGDCMKFSIRAGPPVEVVLTGGDMQMILAKMSTCILKARMIMLAVEWHICWLWWRKRPTVKAIFWQHEWAHVWHPRWGIIFLVASLE